MKNKIFFIFFLFFGVHTMHGNEFLENLGCHFCCAPCYCCVLSFVAMFRKHVQVLDEREGTSSFFSQKRQEQQERKERREIVGEFGNKFNKAMNGGKKELNDLREFLDFYETCDSIRGFLESKMENLDEIIGKSQDDKKAMYNREMIENMESIKQVLQKFL